MELLQEYHLISLDTFKKYRYSDIKEGRIDITAYDYDVTQYKGVVSDTMKRNRLMYLSLFVAENSEEIDQLVNIFPELSDIRQELNEYLVRPKEAEKKAKAEAEKEVKEEIERLKAEIEQLKKNQQ